MERELPMKVVLINRAKGEFWSIEALFESIANAWPTSVQHRFECVPRSGASFKALLANLWWASKVSDTDIIHVTGDIHYAVIGMWRTPSILTIHDMRFIENQPPVRRWLFWLLWIYLPCRRASQVTVISNATKEKLKSFIRLSDCKLAVIPDCVGAEFTYCPKTTLSDPPVVLHVGTTPNKNLDRLAEACSGMEMELWILGRLKEEQKANLSARRIKYREFFDLSRSEVVQTYQQCDIVSFVSLYEGFGLPILEGQAVGRPVLTSNISPMNEVSGDGALQVDPENVEAIRAGLRALLSDSNLRAGLVQKGLTNVSKYSAEAVAQQYHELYRKVVQASA